MILQVSHNKIHGTSPVSLPIHERVLKIYGTWRYKYALVPWILWGYELGIKKKHNSTPKKTTGYQPATLKASGKMDGTDDFQAVFM